MTRSLRTPLNLLAVGLTLFASHTFAHEHGNSAAEKTHRNADIAAHRTIAAAHEAAAKCLESGKSEESCQAELRKACKGLALGKFCGMKHSD